MWKVKGRKYSKREKICNEAMEGTVRRLAQYRTNELSKNKDGLGNIQGRQRGCR